MNALKDILLGCTFAVCLYVVFGGYIVAMFNGDLPAMENHEPKRSCAVFQDGTSFGRDSVISIDAYHEKTGQTFDYTECEK